MPTSSKSAPAICRTTTCLDEVGQTRKPVMVKRGLAASYEEWLLAAEYVMSARQRAGDALRAGHSRASSSSPGSRWTWPPFPVIQRLSPPSHHVADPSHSTGKWYLVTPVALAAVAAGAHGLLIEVHPNPDLAKCDGPQSLTFQNFDLLMEQVNAIKSVRREPVAATTA